MVTSIDFSQGVDFKPLENLGVDKTGAIKLLAALAGFINLEFQAKIKGAFTQEELKNIGQEAAKQGIKPEDGLEFLEGKYQAKTGNYFLEVMRQLYNEYVLKLAQILSEVRSGAAKISQADTVRQKQLGELVNQQQWEEAGKLMEQILKE